jgi:hypothetical protein
VEFRKKLWAGSKHEVPIKEYYADTRSFILSPQNANFFSNRDGSVVGLGSEHESHGLRPKFPGPECRGHCIWHLGLIMQGWTSDNQEERNKMMNMLYGIYCFNCFSIFHNFSAFNFFWKSIRHRIDNILLIVCKVGVGWWPRTLARRV